MVSGGSLPVMLFILLSVVSHLRSENYGPLCTFQMQTGCSTVWRISMALISLP